MCISMSANGVSMALVVSDVVDVMSCANALHRQQTHGSKGKFTCVFAYRVLSLFLLRDCCVGAGVMQGMRYCLLDVIGICRASLVPFVDLAWIGHPNSFSCSGMQGRSICCSLHLEVCVFGLRNCGRGHFRGRSLGRGGGERRWGLLLVSTIVVFWGISGRENAYIGTRAMWCVCSACVQLQVGHNLW